MKQSKIFIGPAGLIVAGLALTLVGHTPAQDRIGGAYEFQTSCAVCHGRDAKGGGPLADKLTRPPPDLTLLSENNGGIFPDERVRQTIDGQRLVVFHGPREMPIWGDRFRAGADEATVRRRIAKLISFLKSIQSQ